MLLCSLPVFCPLPVCSAQSASPQPFPPSPPSPQLYRWAHDLAILGAGAVAWSGPARPRLHVQDARIVPETPTCPPLRPHRARFLSALARNRLACSLFASRVTLSLPDFRPPFQAGVEVLLSLVSSSQCSYYPLPRILPPLGVPTVVFRDPNLPTPFSCDGFVREHVLWIAALEDWW